MDGLDYSFFIHNDVGNIVISCRREIVDVWIAVTLINNPFSTAFFQVKFLTYTQTSLETISTNCKTG